MDLKTLTDEQLDAELKRRSEEKLQAATDAQEKERIRVEALAREANVKIEKILGQARDLIKQAERLADEAHTGFYWDLAYGMGGYYNGGQGEDGYREHGWSSSSSNC